MTALPSAATIAKQLGDPMPEHADVADWIEQHDRAGSRLAQLAKDAPEWEPGAEPEGDDAGDDEDESDAEITRLAKLSTVAYERERKAAAERLGLRAPILDKLVDAERGETGGRDKQGRAITFAEPEPWPEPIDGGELLDEIAKAIRLYVVLPEYSCDTAALWVVHSYLVERFLISPRLCIRSPVKQCGKSTLLGVLEVLVLRPQKNDNATVAAIFRIIEAHRPTLLLDEADTFIDNENSELRGILNSGHRQGGAVLRVVGDDHEVRAFSTFGACVIALIGTLPATLHDRSVTVDLKRKLGAERVELFTLDCHGHLDTLARKAARWAQDHGDHVAGIKPEMPAGIVNREADNWKPLLAIADAAGGGWPKRARKAAEQAHMAGAMDDASRLELLLANIRDIFAERNVDKIKSADLVAALVGIEGSPWVEMGRSRKPLTQNGLSRMLKNVIAPENIRVGDKVPKGYLLSRFEDAFKRYLPSEGGSEPLQRYNADGSSTSEAFQTATQDEDVADRKDEKSNNDGHCSGVADGKGVSEEEGHSTPFGTCVQCHGLTPDAPLMIRGDGYPPAGVHLHKECSRFWLKEHRATRERFRRVDAAAPGTCCAQCHRPDGEVARWRDSHAPGSKSEVLHEACCAEWWRDA